MNFDKRISNLEKRIANIDLTNTKIDCNSISQEERDLLGNILLLKEKKDNGILSKNEMDDFIKMAYKSFQMYSTRITFMYLDVLKALCQLVSNDDAMDFIVEIRLFWFVNELIRHSVQLREESRLMKEYKDDEQFEKAWKKYEKTLEDKTPLWGQESITRDLNKVFKKMEKKSKK
jgi:hypothetical protein